MSDPITQVWVNDNHFLKKWTYKLDEKQWNDYHKLEQDFFDDRDISTKVIEINSDWKPGTKLPDTLSFLKNFVGTITSEQFFQNKIQKNRVPWNVSYYFEFKDESAKKTIRTYEKSKGIGLTQSVISNFGASVEMLHLFQKRSSEFFHSFQKHQQGTSFGFLSDKILKFEKREKID